MSQLAFDYGIHSDLPARIETPASIGAKFLATLEALSDLDQTVFTDWQIMDYSQKQHPSTVAAARSRIAAIIDNNVCRDDLAEPNPDWGGYTASAFTGTDRASRRVSVRIVTGAKRKGEIWLSTGDFKALPDQTIVTYPLFKAEMVALSTIWHPLWACVYAFSMDYDEAPLFPGAALFPYSRFHILWIAYLSPALTVHLALSPDVRTERTPDGGLLMTATEERLDPMNPDHWRRARILADLLVARTGYKFGRRR
jgi:hypothetical protein